MIPFIALNTATTAEGSTNSFTTMLVTFLPLVLMFVVMYFLLIRPQKKREKEAQNMRNNIQVGDEVVTAGGIVGTVVNIKEDTITIETASERSKIRIKRWAVQNNNTVHDQPAK